MVQFKASLQPTPHTEEIGARCKLSKAFERAGNFADAESILGHYWQGAGVKPDLSGLPLAIAAEVLLRVGVLTAWRGGLFDGTNDHQTAESIISEALSLYSTLQLTQKVAEAQIELAECHRRNNRTGEARKLLHTALDLIEGDCELKALAVLRLAKVEMISGGLAASLAILDSSRALLESSDDASLVGNYYSSLVAVLLLTAESDTPHDGLSPYLDRVFIACAVARMFYEQSGNKQGVAEMENNLGYAYHLKGFFSDALEHLDQAHEAFAELGMRSMMACVDESRARVLLALDNAVDAELYASSAVVIMDEGREQWALPAALVTHGRALARLNRHTEARAAFERARSIAESADDLKAMKSVDDAIAECLPRTSNVVCMESRRKITEWQIADDSMEAAGMHQGRVYEFRVTKKWEDGDIAAVETHDGKYIAYIHKSHPTGVWLKWAKPSINPKWYASVIVHGILVFI